MIPELAHQMLSERVVFVDAAGLADSRRKILTGWANSEKVKAVIVDRKAFEELRFARLWRLSSPSPDGNDLVRPLALRAEIEWVDPLDIKVVRPKKTVGSTPTGKSTVVVHRLQADHDRGGENASVDSIVEEVRTARHGWAIIDTRARLAELPRALPGYFVAISSGQRPALLVRKQLGDRALTVSEFLERRPEIFDAVLTPKERRYIADQHVLTLDGITQCFLRDTAWIEATEDDKVRSIAHDMASVVKTHDARVHSRSDSAWSKRISFLLRAVRGVTWGEQWLIDNCTLGKFAPALVAAQTTAFGMWRDRQASPSTIDLIRNTIATQLV